MTATAPITGDNVLQAIERLRPLITQYSDQAEQDRRPHADVVDAMKQEGLFDLWLPREFGGAELDLPSYLAAIESMSSIDSSAAWTFAVLATSACQAAFLPEDSAKEVYGSEALSAGSIIPRGRAKPVDGGYRVSGRWPLASGCHHAEWLGGNSLVFEGEAPRMNPHGIPDFTLMFFRAEDCTILDTWYSTGMRGTGSTDFVAEDVFVPQHRTFSVFTQTPRVSGRLYRMSLDMLFLTALATIPLGIARSAIDTFVDIATSKTPTLSQTALGDRPTVHAEVAKAEARLQSARAYLHEVGRDLMDAVINGDSVPPAIESRRRLACLNAAESCETVVDSMYRLAGTSAIYTGNPLDRCLRDVHTVNQHLAVSPVWWEKTGQYYFGQPLGMP